MALATLKGGFYQVQQLSLDHAFGRGWDGQSAEVQLHTNSAAKTIFLKPCLC